MPRSTRATRVSLILARKTFDIIICNIVFSSILDLAVRRSLADRIMRLLGPEGVLLWTDFTFNNPQNADVLRVTRTDVCNLFPNFELHLLRRHLAPPLARTVLRGGSAGRMLYSMLNVVPLLRTHLIGGLQPRRVPETGGVEHMHLALIGSHADYMRRFRGGFIREVADRGCRVTCFVPDPATNGLVRSSGGRARHQFATKRTESTGRSSHRCKASEGTRYCQARHCCGVFG